MTLNYPMFPFWCQKRAIFLGLLLQDILEHVTRLELDETVPGMQPLESGRDSGVALVPINPADFNSSFFNPAPPIPPALPSLANHQEGLAPVHRVTLCRDS